jgi:predicted glutamine amidotransferase
MLAAAWDRPVPFAELVRYAADLERYGIAGYGWGVAWRTPNGRLLVCRGLGRFADEAPDAAGLSDAVSDRFLVHLRRPNKLSTIQPADTQPFLTADASGAFAHNGFLERAEEIRPRYADRLAGRADSEVGFAYFTDRLAEGLPPEKALQDVAATFTGTANESVFGYVYRDARGGECVPLGGGITVSGPTAGAP